VTAARALLLAAVVLSGAACAARGPAFQSVSAPADKALVYIYRPNQSEGAGVRFHVTDARGPIVWLEPGGYFPYLAAPGEAEFWAETMDRASVTEQLVAGKTYYLMGSVEPGLVFGRPELVFVPAETARPEVEKCVQLPHAEVTGEK
jgi:hypothetical protein